MRWFSALTLLLFLTPLLHAAPPSAPETTAGRFARMERATTTASPLTALLAAWDLEDLAPLLPGGPARAHAAALALLRRSAPPVDAETALVALRLRALTSASTPALPPPGPTAAALATRAGLPSSGFVMGPFPGSTPSTPPRQAPWRAFSLPPTGRLPLGDLLTTVGDSHARLGFAFEVSTPLSTRVLLGANGPISVTLDGISLIQQDSERPLGDRQLDPAVDLAPGTHWLEITVGHPTEPPEVAVRIPGVTFIAPPSPPSALGTWRPAAHPTPSLPALAPRDTAALARLAARTDATPQEAVRQLSAALAASAKAPPSIRADLAYDLGRAQLVAHPSDATASLTLADTLRGGHAQALAALLDLAERDALPARAINVAHRLRALDPTHPALIGYDLLRLFELSDAASALPAAQGAADRIPSLRLIILASTIAERAHHLALAARYAALAAALQGGAPEPTERATRLFLRAGDKPAALAAVDQALALRPFSGDLRLIRARTLAADGDAAGLQTALAELDRDRPFHRNNPLYEELRGRLLILAGDHARAIDALDRALELAPQNRDLADYRRTLVSERGLADRWAEPVDALQARAARIPAQPEGAVSLFERTVTEVFPSGLSSEFRQLAFRVDRAEASERFQDFSFPFTPGEDRIEVIEAEIIRRDGRRLRPLEVTDRRQDGRMGGIYTLTAFKVVRFPSLEVGDIIQLQLRKDEIGSRNLFGDFFGVVYPIASDLRKAEVDITVLAPASRPLSFGTHQVPPPTVTVHDGQQRLALRLTDVPPIAIEPGMPGFGDVGAWLSVSTFATWDALTRWYRDLIVPQLDIPPALAATARALVADKPTTAARVAAIHAWAVGQTRYVGIEFGIHGFKPYKITDILQRGYGDCKDKAALLVAMLHAVEIPAEFVLVRTRDLGTLDGTPPTLWAFNHAIAYIPELDRYLDGTAEFAGLDELPELDQDAQVLRFDPYTTAPPTLTRIPIQPPESNHVSTHTTYTLAPSGDATATLRETIAGTSSGRLRARLQDASRRDAFIAEVLGGQLPGTTVSDIRYEHLQTLGAPIAIEAKLALPHLATPSAGALSLPITLDAGQRLATLAPLATRRQALILMVSELETTEDRYLLPEGATVPSLPAPQALTSRFGAWSFSASLDGNTLITRTRWELIGERIEPADYPAFRAFLQSVGHAEAQRVRIVLPPP